jgi:restriction endonuclease Mrr
MKHGIEKHSITVQISRMKNSDLNEKKSYEKPLAYKSVCNTVFKKTRGISARAKNMVTSWQYKIYLVT